MSEITDSCLLVLIYVGPEITIQIRRIQVDWFDGLVGTHVSIFT